MSERIKSTAEQIADFQAAELLNIAKGKGYVETSWDIPQIKEALCMFAEAIEKTKPLAAYAEIGPCPQEGDECDSECELPNTLTVTPIFGEFDPDRDSDWFQATGQWFNRDDWDLRRTDSQLYCMELRPRTRDAWEQDFSDRNFVKIFPL